MLQTGTIVSYTPGNDGASYPAIVFRQWPEGTIELHVFHFESGTHVRAAHPSQIKPMIDPAHLATLADETDRLCRRMTELEGAFEAVRPLLAKLRELAGEPEPQPESPVPVDASEIDLPESGEETLVGVESTQAADEPNFWKKKGRK